MENNQFGNPTENQFISFQDFSPINRSSGAGQAQLNVEPTNQPQFGGINLTNDPMSIDMMDDLQSFAAQKTEEVTVEKSFWTFDYFKKFFNVNTDDVLQRLKGSMLPHTPENYLLTKIRPNPDLYGPFWVCVTLIFSIAISGNLANYFQAGHSKTHHWKYEFHLVSRAATAICLYVWLLPLGLWGAMKWSNPQRDTSLDDELIEDNQYLGLLELLCLYGYSLTIYVPVAFLWTIQIGWFQWLLVGVASLMSGGVLIKSLFPLITGKQKGLYLLAITIMHFLLAVGFMLYFFHVPTLHEIQVPESLATTVANIPASIAKVVDNTVKMSVNNTVKMSLNNTVKMSVNNSSV